MEIGDRPRFRAGKGEIGDKPKAPIKTGKG